MPLPALLLSDREQFDRRVALAHDWATALERIDDALRLPIATPATEMPRWQDRAAHKGDDPVDLVKWHFEQRQLEAVERGVRTRTGPLVIDADFRSDCPSA